VTKKEKVRVYKTEFVATVHVPLKADQKEKLDKMTLNDHRRHTDFMRMLVEQEWERRQQVDRALRAQPRSSDR
jgi:hypothetical protein